MLTGESLSTLLYAIATESADQAKFLVADSDDLNEQERVRFLSVIQDDAASAVEQARHVGDAVRELGGSRDLANECYRLAFYLSDDSAELACNPLFAYFVAHRAGRLLDKWAHYFPIYHRHLAPYRDQAPRLLEIGVYRGGSLDMWRRYLGTEATLIGIDIDEMAAQLADPAHTIVIGDQADPDFLSSVVDRYGPFDVVIDDGGHTMEQQIASVETLFPTVSDGGLYLVEDCHTSYWPEYGGGRSRQGTFVEWVKSRIDDLHGYHQASSVEPVWTDHVDGIHCYDSIVVLDKKQRYAPFSEQVGLSDFVFRQRPASDLVDQLLVHRNATAAQRDAAFSEVDRLRSEVDVTRRDLDDAWAQLRAIRATSSWRVTAPARALMRRLRDRR